MMLLAAGWTWPATFVALAVISGVTAVLMVLFAPHPDSGATALASPRLKTIEEDLVAVREDLADIKDSLAELERMFKSVG